jgi:glycosyltransferase involved in cell wall biosynthesis
MDRRKKVVIIGSAYPLRGGLSNFNERLAEELLVKGYDVSIETFSLQYPSFLFPGKTQLSSEPYSGNVPIRVGINSINPLNWIKIGLKLRKLSPDLIIIKFWIPFMAPCFGTILRIAKKKNHPFRITIIDNILPHEKRPFDKLFVRYFVKSIDGFVTMSRSVLDQISQFDKGKPRIFSPHPIYDNFGKPIPKETALELLNLERDKKYILFFGFIRDYKGLDILLKAFGDSDFREMGIKLIVAGEFYCSSEPYFNLINEYGIKDDVIMVNDFIPDSKVATYFSACDLVVQPYKSATQSGVTQIAYNFNKPMIVTDVGGLEEFVPDNKVGFVVAPNPDDVAQAIKKYFKNDFSIEFSRNIELEKEKYSWNYFISNLESVYL